MTHDEQKTPAQIMGDLLSTLLFRAYDQDRRWLFSSELDACQYLLKELDAGRSVGSDWTANFLKCNRAMIEAGHIKPIDFNLRAFRLKQGDSP